MVEAESKAPASSQHCLCECLARCATSSLTVIYSLAVLPQSSQVMPQGPLNDRGKVLNPAQYFSPKAWLPTKVHQ